MTLKTIKDVINKYIIYKKLQNISYRRNANSIDLETYFEQQNLKIEFGNRGPNNLPDFKNVIANNTIIGNNGSDWCMPYIILALNNIDGDKPNYEGFTGGNHNYNNTGLSDSSATARNLYIKYYADGKLLTSTDIGTCNQIRIEWCNYIQGANTIRENGSGGEILMEKRTLLFDGYEIEIIADIMPLENVLVKRWYFQGARLLNLNNVIFIGGDNRYADTLDNLPYSGNATPNAMLCYSDTNVLELEIDRTYDLGKGAFFEGNDGMFISGNSGNYKGYCYIIKETQLEANKHYYARAYYRFKPNISLNN